MKFRIIVFVCVMTLALGSVFAEEIKGQDEPIGHGEAVRATGGPDTFGYTWADQAEGSCPYQFVEISGTGTDLGDGDDDAFVQALGGPAFNFYGTTYADVTAATNGYLSFGDTSGGDHSNDCPLPATPSIGAGGRIYPLQDDLDVDPLCDDCAVYFEYFATCPRPNDDGIPGTTGCNVIQWDAQHFSGGAGPSTECFQAILYDTYEIVVQVATQSEGGSGSTTGIQNPAADDGLTYACDSAGSIVDGTAVCFFHPTPVPVDLQFFTAE